MRILTFIASLLNRAAFVIVYDNTGFAVASYKCVSRKSALRNLPYFIDFANGQNDWVDHTAAVYRERKFPNLYEFSYAPKSMFHNN